MAGEKHAHKRLYGPAMVTNIHALNTTLTDLLASLESIAETIDPDYQLYHQKLQREVDEKRREEEQQALVREQEQRERDAQEAQKEALRLKQEEDARLKRQEEQRQEEERLAEQKSQEEARVKAEQEALAAKQLEKEKADAASKLRAEADAAKAAAAAKAAQALEKQNATITITIKTTKGKVLTLKNVPPNCTVANFKTLIAQQHDIPEPSQRLIFRGRMLADLKNISDYNIVDACAVHLVQNTRSVASITTKSTPAPLVPPGTVCHLNNGSDQFNQIAVNCATHRLLVVDWSAPWCGPCRMIAPVFERLASRFSDVTFVKVDTEASPPNSQLASEKAIQAYPTFHYYIDNILVHHFAGANATDIENGIKKYRTQIINQAASSSSSRSTAGPSPSGALTRTVLTALTTLKNNCSRGDFTVAVSTLLTFVKNVADNPTQEKYRKVRTGNNTFQTRLASKTGGLDCMRAFGFVESSEAGVNFLSMTAEAALNPELRTIKTQLEQALAASTAHVATSARPPSMPAPPAAAQPGAPPANMGARPNPMLAGMQNMPNMNSEFHQSMYSDMMANPEFMRIAGELANDPTALNTMMQLQSAIASGDHNALQTLQADPNFARLNAAITSNPALLNSLMNRMNEGGMPGMPGMGRTVGGGAANPAARNNQGAATTQNAQPAYPGAPSTAEEEERLLQEAIRLSMQDVNRSDTPKEQDDTNKDSNNQN